LNTGIDLKIIFSILMHLGKLILGKTNSPISTVHFAVLENLQGALHRHQKNPMFRNGIKTIVIP